MLFAVGISTLFLTHSRIDASTQLPLINLYPSSQEDYYIQLAAMHYYVKFGSEYSVENVHKVIDELIPTQLIESKSKTKWTQFISSAHKEVKHALYLCVPRIVLLKHNST